MLLHRGRIIKANRSHGVLAGQQVHVCLWSRLCNAALWPLVTPTPTLTWKPSPRKTWLLFKSPASPIRPPWRVRHITSSWSVKLSVGWFGRSCVCLSCLISAATSPRWTAVAKAQSTTFNSFINQASVRRMNYWLSEFRGNGLFLLSPWWTCFCCCALCSWSVQHYGTSLPGTRTGTKWQTLQWERERGL